MSKFPIPENEKERLRALHDYEILNSLDEEAFDRITQLASLICNVPISLVSFIDEKRQWFKSKVGIDACETQRDWAFCQYAIMDTTIFEVEDATNDDRFSNNPLVTGDPNIRFYAGYPLIDPRGYALGTLCVIDSQPKKLTENQKKSLQLLTEEVVGLIVERRQKVELKNFEKLFQLSNDLICIAGIHGFFKKINPAFEKILGWDSDFLLNTPYMAMIHPEDVEITQKELGKVVAGFNNAFNVTHRFKTPENQYKILHWVVTYDPLTKELYGIGRDITEEKAREQQLAINEQKLTAFFQNSQGLIFIHDTQGKFLSVNGALINLLGYTSDEIYKLSLSDIVPEDSHSILDTYLIEINTKGRAKGQFVTTHKNGTRKIWMYNNVLEESPEGELYVIGNAIDITEMHSLETDLKRTKEMLEKTNQVARVGGWEMSIEHQKVYWTSVTKEIHAVDPDYEVDLKNGIEFYKEGESRDKINEAINLAINEGKPSDLELQIIDKTGKEIWVRVLLNAEMDQSICKRIYGTFQDIDEKKKAEIELKASKKLLEDVIHSLTEVSVIATDPDGIITIFNTGAENLLGYSAEEMIGKQKPDIFHSYDEVVKRGKELSAEFGYPIEGKDVFLKIPQSGGFEKREWTYIRKDGSTVIVSLVVLVMQGKNGSIRGNIGIATDITDLKKTKSDLEILANRLQKQNSQLLNFAHITSHNLRAPVSNLNSLVYLYNESPNDEDKKMLFTKFETVIKHLSSTLNELIEALKIQEDLTQKSALIRFEDVFTKIKETLIGQLIETKAIVTADFSKADQIQYPQSYLESIILNLFSNAIKYRAPERIPRIHFQTENLNNEIILIVRDNGLGIDLGKHGHKLFGLNKTFHRNPEAKGVGLFITKTQVEAMGGNISAESEVNKGTTFKIVFNSNKKKYE